MLVPIWLCTNIASPAVYNSKLYKYGWSAFSNNARMSSHTDLNRLYINHFFIFQFRDLFYVMVTNYIFDSVTLETGEKPSIQIL